MLMVRKLMEVNAAVEDVMVSGGGSEVWCRVAFGSCVAVLVFSEMLLGVYKSV